MKLIFLFIFQFIASHYMVIKSCYLLLVEIKYGNTLLFIVFTFLSQDIASGSEITPCNKINKPLVGYRFSGKVMK